MSIGIKPHNVPEKDTNAQQRADSQTPNAFTVISRADAPKLYAILDEQMALLNNHFGAHHPTPMIVRDAADCGNEYIRLNNSIELTPSTIALLETDPAALAYVMGHELTHYFLGKDTNSLSKRESARDKVAFDREVELTSDRVGVLFSSPEALSRELESEYAAASRMPDNRAVILYKRIHKLDFNTARNEYSTPEQKKAMLAQVNGMSQVEKDSLSKEFLKDYLAWEITHESELPHPTLGKRKEAVKDIDRGKKPLNEQLDEILKNENFCNPHGNLGGTGSTQCGTQQLRTVRNSARDLP